MTKKIDRPSSALELAQEILNGTRCRKCLYRLQDILSCHDCGYQHTCSLSQADPYKQI